MFPNLPARVAMAAIGLVAGSAALQLWGRNAHSAAVLAAAIAVIKQRGRQALPGIRRGLLLAAGTAGAAGLGARLARREHHRILNPPGSHRGHESESKLAPSLLPRPTYKAAGRNNEQAARGRQSRNDPRRDPWHRSR